MTKMGAKLLFLASVIASAASATSYDAVSGFSSSNPSGTWAYGTGVTGSTFTAMSVYNAGTCAPEGSGVSCWKPTVTVDNDPQVAINNTASTITFESSVFPTGTLLLHPGESTDTIVTWTAPAAGTYDIAGFFELLDDNPTGVIGSVYSGSNELYTTGALTGPPANLSTLTVGGKDTFSLTTSLAAGAVLSFGVNNDGDFFDDSTGFDATITSVNPPTISPEPSSVFFLTGGLAAICGFNRRKLVLRQTR